MMDEHDDVIERLKALGRRPVDPALQSAHLTAMAAVRPSTGWTKVRVVAAFLAGLLLGGSGLAAAGALPDPAQNVAHKAFAEVGVQVPQPERYHAAECGDEVKANHGAYVRDDKSLAKTDCGKPVKAAGDRRQGGPGDGGPAERGPCQGPPPWALDKSMTDAEKTAAQAQRAIDCPDAADDAAESEAQDAEIEAPERSTGAAVPSTEPTTTTTAPAPTTTTTAPETGATDTTTG